MGVTIFDFFGTSVFLDYLEVDAFLFSIVTIISLTNFDSRGWNVGRRLVADDCYSAGACECTTASSGCSRMVVLRGLGLVVLRVRAGADAARWG